VIFGYKGSFFIKKYNYNTFWAERKWKTKKPFYCKKNATIISLCSIWSVNIIYYQFKATITNLKLPISILRRFVYTYGITLVWYNNNTIKSLPSIAISQYLCKLLETTQLIVSGTVGGVYVSRPPSECARPHR